MLHFRKFFTKFQRSAVVENWDSWPWFRLIRGTIAGGPHLLIEENLSLLNFSVTHLTFLSVYLLWSLSILTQNSVSSTKRTASLAHMKMLRQVRFRFYSTPCCQVLPFGCLPLNVFFYHFKCFPFVAPLVSFSFICILVQNRVNMGPAWLIGCFHAHYPCSCLLTQEVPT